ncbi:MAG: AMP-binding protein [Clostridiales Family XIII bacterium]|nr:AMP-binding protein [Clostridiales Family XIII bacterium]
MSMPGTVLDAWTARKIGLPAGALPRREDIERYQLAMLCRTLQAAKEHSPFYARRLAGIDVLRDIARLEDVRRIPFTTESDLRDSGLSMLCVPQRDVSRIVTLQTSGSAGKPKRIYFTEADQELTVDFFHCGMRVMVDESDLVLILLPCERPGSVGDLLRRGLARGGTESIPYGPLPRDDASLDAAVLDLIRARRVSALVGGPAEIARLARGGAANGVNGASVRSVLLSTEYVSDENRRTIEECWDCKVFEHYGTTESGLGGAMACHVREGYHPREADLLFEIIDPESGRPLPDGAWGEVVFTTLTRRAMPFIRYRIGDVGRWLPAPCGCGSALKRLDRIGDRAAVKKRPGA